jgi:hypothetical protein
MAPALGSEDGRQHSVASEDNDRWSLYGAPWLQPVAISGKCSSPENARSKPKPLPWVATSCLRRSMVRRGSTVRVRQRALQKPRSRGVFRSVRLAGCPACGGYGALYGAFRSKTPLWTGCVASPMASRRPSATD